MATAPEAPAPTWEMFVPDTAGATRVETERAGVRLKGGAVCARGDGRVIQVPTRDVRRAVWLTPQQTRAALGLRAGPVTRSSGLVVLLGDEGPLLAFAVAEFCPTAGDPTDRLASSGAAALASRLGTVIEPMGADVEGLESVEKVFVTTGHHRGMRAAVATVAAAATGVLGFLALANVEIVGRVALAGSFLLGGLLVAWLVRERRRFQRAVNNPPARPDSLTYPPGQHPPAVPRLHLSSTEILAWSGGMASRRRGPLVDAGITTCQIGPDVVRFVDARHLDHLTYDAADLCPTDQHRDLLRRTCAEAGLRVHESPLPLDIGRVRHLWTHGPRRRPGCLMSPVETGAIGGLVPLWAGMSLPIQLAGSLAHGVASGGVAWLLAVPSLAQILALAWTHRSFRAWQRDVLHAPTTGDPA